MICDLLEVTSFSSRLQSAENVPHCVICLVAHNSEGFFPDWIIPMFGCPLFNKRRFVVRGVSRSNPAMPLFEARN